MSPVTSICGRFASGPVGEDLEQPEKENGKRRMEKGIKNRSIFRTVYLIIKWKMEYGIWKTDLTIFLFSPFSLFHAPYSVLSFFLYPLSFLLYPLSFKF